MGTLALIFLWTSYVLSLLGSLWIIVEAWQEGVVWGAFCFLCFPFQWIYVARRWKQTKTGFFMQLAGFAAFVISAIIRGVACIGLVTPHLPGYYALRGKCYR